MLDTVALNVTIIIQKVQQQLCPPVYRTPLLISSSIQFESRSLDGTLDGIAGFQIKYSGIEHDRVGKIVLNRSKELDDQWIDLVYHRVDVLNSSNFGPSRNVLLHFCELGIMKEKPHILN